MKVKRVLSKRYRSRMRSFSKKTRARLENLLSSDRREEIERERERERDREKREKRERDFSRTLPLPFSTLDFTHKERARGCTKTSPTRALYLSLSPFTLQMHKKEVLQNELTPSVVRFARRSLRYKRACFLSFSLSPLTMECVFVWTKELLFFTSLSSPFLCFDLVVDKKSSSSADLIKK